jgi:hypothetical protein
MILEYEKATPTTTVHAYQVVKITGRMKELGEGTRDKIKLHLTQIYITISTYSDTDIIYISISMQKENWIYLRFREINLDISRLGFEGLEAWSWAAAPAVAPSPGSNAWALRLGITVLVILATGSARCHAIATTQWQIRHHTCSINQVAQLYRGGTAIYSFSLTTIHIFLLSLLRIN